MLGGVALFGALKTVAWWGDLRVLDRGALMIALAPTHAQAGALAPAAVARMYELWEAGDTESMAAARDLHYRLHPLVDLLRKNFAIDEEDMQRVLRHPASMIASASASKRFSRA